MYLIYNILFCIIFTPIALFASIFSKKFRSGFFTKLGFYSFKNSEKTLWIHAISVGEVLAAEGLINKLKEKNKLLITTSTPTGQELAQKKFSNFAKVTYFPFDYPMCVNAAFKSFNPEKVLVIETEIWPNFVKMAKKLNVPVYIVNGRISENSFKGYEKIKIFFKEVFKNYHKFLMQSDEDARRIKLLGAEEEKVEVCGNVKFDIKRKENSKIDLKNGENPIMIGASTHKGEDEIVLGVFKKLKKSFPNLRLLLAPRHPERLEEVEKLTGQTGFNYTKRSENKGFKEDDIMILDTMGELSSLFENCRFAFIGGSFNKTGGHNPLEATIYEKPVISGENISNFRLIYKVLCENNCATIVHNEDEFYLQALKLLEDENFYKKVCTNCKTVFEKNRGAVEKILAQIK